jgi:uncharacterized membrane protein
MWEHHHGYGFFPFGIFFILLAILIFSRIIAYRRFGRYGSNGVCGGYEGPTRHGWSANNLYEAEAIIRKRLASGEIDEEEYLRLKEILSK